MSSADTVAAVVLAAGGSRRLGRPKQLVRVAGRTLVRRAAEAAVEAGCRPVVVVVGASADAVELAVEPLGALGVRTVRCEAWREGLGASLRCGVEALPASGAGPTGPEDRAGRGAFDGVHAAADVAAVVLLPCDLPALGPAVIRRLIEAWDGSEEGRVACAYAGTLGSPALFGRALFPRLLVLGGDVGAKGLLAGAATVPWAEGARDVDTPEDL